MRLQPLGRASAHPATTPPRSLFAGNTHRRRRRQPPPRRLGRFDHTRTSNQLAFASLSANQRRRHHLHSVPGPSRLWTSEHHGSPTPGLRDPDRLRLLHRATPPPSPIASVYFIVPPCHRHATILPFRASNRRRREFLFS